MEVKEEPAKKTWNKGPVAHSHFLLVKLEELWVWIHRVQGPIDEMHCKGSTDRAFLFHKLMYSLIRTSPRVIPSSHKAWEASSSEFCSCCSALGSSSASNPQIFLFLQLFGLEKLLSFPGEPAVKQGMLSLLKIWS